MLLNGKVENFFWSQGILYKCGRLSKERVNVATNLEQYTWSNFINYFSQFFQPEKFIFGIKVELLDYFFSFNGYHFIMKLVWPPCGLCSALCTVWWIAHAPNDATMLTYYVLHEHIMYCTNPLFRLPRFYRISWLQKNFSIFQYFPNILNINNILRNPPCYHKIRPPRGLLCT